jgi:hypothetical protein
MQKWFIIIVLLSLTGCTPDPAREFEIAKTLGTVKGYSLFLTEFPDSKHAEEAMQLLEEAHFNQVKQNIMHEELEAFLIKFPNGKFASEVNILLKQLTEK